MAASPAEIRLAYRHLYQGLLRAVQYAKPARYIVRDQLRAGFEPSRKNTFEPARIATTLEFLDGAVKHRGLEHKILKNLVHVHWGREKMRLAVQRRDIAPLRRSAYKAFDQTVRKLNETMGLYLR